MPKVAVLKTISQALCVVSLASFALSSRAAESIYSYSGDQYDSFPVTSGYTSTNSITAMLETASPLLPDQSYAWGFGGIGTATDTDALTGFSETDGNVAYTAAGGINIFVTTNSSGQIATWYVGSCGTCTDASINVDTQFGILTPGFNPEALDGSSLGGTLLAYVDGSPGTWTESTSVPEPTTLGLLAFGLAGIALARRKSKS